MGAMVLIFRWFVAPFVLLILVIAVVFYLPEIFPDYGMLEDAIASDDVDRVRTLLDRGADPNSRNILVSAVRRMWRYSTPRSGTAVLKLNREPLLCSAITPKRIAIARLLLERGANPNVRDRFGNTPLWQAVPLGDASLIALLLEKGADARLVMGDGSTALREAPKPPPVFETDDPKIQQLIREAAARPRYRTTNPQVIRLLMETEARR